MERTRNYQLTKTRFIYVVSGKNQQHVFALPTIFYSRSRHLSWDMKVWALVFAWGSAYFQINFCKATKDLNTTLYKQDVANIMAKLKAEGLYVKDIQGMLDFLNRNPQFIIFYKNADLDHYYANTIFKEIFSHCDFVTGDKALQEKTVH